MNEAEKERLIKKDIESIENRVRHAFNQGYEMGMKDREKLNCTDCIIEKSDSFIKSCLEIPNTCGDAISRKYILDLIDTKGANLDDDLLIVEQWIQDAPSVNPHPIECGDAISRQAVLDLMRGLTRWCVRSEDGKWKNVGLLYDDVMFGIDGLPSVTPQQRAGRWIKTISENGVTSAVRCSECGFEDNRYMLFRYCPNCGCKMREVEE